MMFYKRFLFKHVLNFKSSDSCFNAQKMKFPIKDFYSKCDQIPSFLRIWLYLLKKPLMENFIYCAVFIYTYTASSITDVFERIW